MYVVVSTFMQKVDIDEVIFLIQTLEHNLIYVHLCASQMRYPTVSVEDTDHSTVSDAIHIQKSRPTSIFSS